MSDPNAYVGEWVLEVGPSNCGAAFQVHFSIPQKDADRAHLPEFLNVVGQWWFADATWRLPVTGSINWHRDDFDLRFHKKAVQGHFTGKGVTPARLEGSFVDPGGDFWVSLTSRNCVAAAVATKQPVMGA